MQKTIKINGGYAVIEYYEAAQPTVINDGKPTSFEKFFSIEAITLYAKHLLTGDVVAVGIESFQLKEIAAALTELEGGRHEITEEEFIDFQS